MARAGASTYKRRGIGEAIGAVLVLVLLIATTAARTFSILHMYGAPGASHSAQVTTDQPARENLSIVYVAHIPPLPARGTGTSSGRSSGSTGSRPGSRTQTR